MMKLAEIAAEIDGYLKKFEADPQINVKKVTSNLHKYWKAGAYSTGRFVGVVYVSFQTGTSLSKDEALEYLEWLRAGNIGTHFTMKHQKKGKLQDV